MKWRQICLLISLPVVYTQHCDWFRHCEGDNWFKEKKKNANPSSHSTLLASFLPSPLSLQSAAKMKSLIRQRKDKKTLLVISLPSHKPSHASRFSFSLKQCDFHASVFVFVCKRCYRIFRARNRFLLFYFRFSDCKHHLNLWTLISLHHLSEYLKKKITNAFRLF